MTEQIAAVAPKAKHIDLVKLGSDLLTMAAISCASLGVWRMGVDFGWTNDFVIESGLLSHWQIWIVAAVALHIASVSLNRYGTGGSLQAPRILMFPLFPSKMFPRKPSPARKLSSR